MLELFLKIAVKTKIKKPQSESTARLVAVELYEEKETHVAAFERTKVS